MIGEGNKNQVKVSRGEIHSLKLTFSVLKTGGWKTILSFWDGPFSGAGVVSGRVTPFIGANNSSNPFIRPFTGATQLHVWLVRAHLVGNDLQNHGSFFGPLKPKIHKSYAFCLCQEFSMLGLEVFVTSLQQENMSLNCDFSKFFGVKFSKHFFGSCLEKNLTVRT